MANDKKKIFEQAKKHASDKDVFFIEDIISLLPISKSSFYGYFPADSDELDELKELLDANKVSKKIAIRKSLGKSEKAGELLALYRLVCTPEEHRMLNQQYIEQNTSLKVSDSEFTVTVIDGKKAE